MDDNLFQIGKNSNTTSVEEYFKNIDHRVNVKIAAGMKKAVHLIVEKFDDIIQDKLNLLVAKKVKDEVDLRMI